MFGPIIQILAKRANLGIVSKSLIFEEERDWYRVKQVGRN
jgi:hypothetical protein